MFWRTALILTLITQPALALAVSSCGTVAGARPGADEPSSSCCCCVDSACPASCPCIVRDDTPDRAPLQPAPATAPATDQLLVIPAPGAVLHVVADAGDASAIPPRFASSAVPTARSLRTLIGVWTT